MLLKSATNEELLLGYGQNGSHELFAELYGRLAAKLRDYLQSVCFDSALADDVAQDAWLNVVRKAHLFHGRSAAYTWICSIGRNRLKSHFRLAYVSRIAPQAPWRFAGLENADKTPPEIACEHEDIESFDRAMSELDQGQRRVVELCDLYELDYEDAALAIGIPVGTVRSRRHRAIANLRKAMAA